jgi:mycothiol system anti-sigma-R factor
MGCDDVKRVLYFFLDGALDDQKRQSVHDHLSHCPDCEQRSLVQRRLRAFVRQRLSRITAPERFKIRLTRTLRVFYAEW